MVETAWASASTFRSSDLRGGANGARIRLEPQKNWEVNNPEQLSKILDIYEKISLETGASVADIIVLSGNLGIEKASGVKVPFTPGRGDATQEQTDVESFSVLEPEADGFRNYLKANYSVSAEDMLIDKAQLLGLSAPEMTVIFGGMRSLGIGLTKDSALVSALASNTGNLNNDFFINFLDMKLEWSLSGDGFYQAINRSTGNKVGSTSRVDLVFGSNSQLRALSEVYACSDSNKKFVKDFISAWNKVMNADRFDLA
jgi:catalase-peroxidase